jgi:PXPV repeat (3 copies)
MNLFFSRKSLAVAALASAALLGATVAEARPDVYVSIGFESGPTWVQPAPVYVQPRPVYVQPAPVYVRPPVFVPPCDVYGRPYRGGYGERHHWERERARRHAEWHRHQRHDGFRGGDRDQHDHGHRGHRY